MAPDTPSHLRNLVIYSVYTRNHGPTGTFADVEADLVRIRSMGVDVVWLMPIHPIGRVQRKGQAGSPYSIADYREVNPEYGTKADFIRLVDHAHALDLKVMIDVVYNHTAHDSVLVAKHPDWFHQDEQGNPVTTVPDWSDVIDLKHPNPALTDYLIETLQMWAKLGVDGFRCDVASVIPIEFWKEARAGVAAVKPNVIWLAESVHASWVSERRARGLPTLSDGELFQAFDLTYDYDIWTIWQMAVQGLAPVGRYLEMLRFQDCIYPQSYVKLRCTENHDQLRIMALAPDRLRALAWTAFAAFNKGAFLIYAGQESAAKHTPTLFEIDRVEWGAFENQTLLSTLASLKKHTAQRQGLFVLMESEPVIQAAWQHTEGSLYGMFNVSGSQGDVRVRLADGAYFDLLRGVEVEVRNGRVPLPADAFILGFCGNLDTTPLYSELLDYRQVV